MALKGVFLGPVFSTGTWYSFGEGLQTAGSKQLLDGQFLETVSLLSFERMGFGVSFGFLRMSLSAIAIFIAFLDFFLADFNIVRKDTVSGGRRLTKPNHPDLSLLVR